MIVSGAADSVLTFWQDCTEEQEVEKESKRATLVLKWVPFRLCKNLVLTISET